MLNININNLLIFIMLGLLLIIIVHLLIKKFNLKFEKLFYENFLDKIMKVKQGPELLDDKLFSDVIPYDNQEDGRIGLDRCLEECNGVCVEYGMTGNAHCFPKLEKQPVNYFNALRDDTFEKNDDERKNKNALFANLR